MPAKGLDRHPSLVDQLVEHVFDRIMRGELAPGQRITEEQLAAEFGVSRTPVREAVKRLAEMGVVRIFPRARLEVATTDLDDLREITQLREDLECLALGYAFAHLTDDSIKRLERLVARCERLAEGGSRVEIFLADSKFHMAIAEMGKNKFLLDLVRRLDVKVQLSRAMMCLSKDKINRSVQFHRQIVDALRKRDLAEAQRLMRQHVRRTLTPDDGDVQ